jgi:hypothetical protein
VALPASTRTVILYLAHVKISSESVNAVKMHSVSISAFHDKNVLESPCREKAIQEFIAGCQRQLGRPAVSREPITKEILRNIISFCTLDGDSGEARPLQFWRQAAFEAAAFLGLCRFSDLERLTWDRVSIDKQGVTLQFLTRKNDQKHFGHKVLLLANKGLFCPVRLFTNYYVLQSKAVGGNYPKSGVFLPAIGRKNGKYIPVPNKAVSHAGMRGVQVSVLAALNLDWKIFGLHSGKIGGAIEAARARHSKEARNSFGGWALGSNMADHYDKKLASRSIRAIARSLCL